jgi:hypothetical protein
VKINLAIVVSLTLQTLLCAFPITEPRDAQIDPNAHGTASQKNASVEGLDIPALIREVAKNERAMTPRRLQYTWTLKQILREVNKRGEVTKESVKVYEVYPVRGEFVKKLLSEDGVPVSAAKADEEVRKATAGLEKAEREQQKRAASQPAPAKPADPTGIVTFGFSYGYGSRSGFSSNEFSFAPWRIFRAAEFYNPRRESLRGRDTLVLDFRPRADFQPADDLSKPYAKLAGRVWIDLTDKALARLEASPTMQSGTQPALGEDAALVYEETRMPDGVWLASLMHINTTANKSAFNGVETNSTAVDSDFKRFDANAGDVKTEPIKPPQP